jgi:hypothetical protein
MKTIFLQPSNRLSTGITKSFIEFSCPCNIAKSAGHLFGISWQQCASQAWRLSPASTRSSPVINKSRLTTCSLRTRCAFRPPVAVA